MGGPALELGLDPIAVGAKGHAVYIAAPTVDNLELNGSVYAVDSDSWRSIPSPPSPLGGRPAVVTTDDELVVWGGGQANGARLGLDEMVWRMMNASGAPPPMAYPAIAWTGDAVFVWGGLDDAYSYIADGGMYDLAQDTWRPVAVWIGERVVVFSDEDTAVYDPIADRWTPAAAPPSRPRWRVWVWDGCRVLAYGSGELWAYTPAL